MNKPIQVIQVTATRESLPLQYLECVEKNPLLARMEVQTKAVGWTDFETRTLQLLTVVQSNASLQGRIKELEADIQMLTTTKGPR